MSMSTSRIARAVAAKDLRIELRSRVVTNFMPTTLSSFFLFEKPLVFVNATLDQRGCRQPKGSAHPLQRPPFPLHDIWFVTSARAHLRSLAPSVPKVGVGVIFDSDIQS